MLHITKSVMEQPRDIPANDVFQLLTVRYDRQELIMSALTDLQAAVQAVQTAVTAAVSALGAANGGVASTDVETAVSALNAAATSLNNAVTPPAAAEPAAPAA